MNRNFKVFWVGLSVSWLGTLPPAVLNLIAIEISMNKGIASALMFSSGVILVEMSFVRASLVAIEWFREKAGWFRAIEWLSIAILAALAFGSFRTALSGGGGSPSHNGFLPDLHPFLIGVTLRFISPTMIPYWFGWSAVLLEQKVLQPRPSQYNRFTIGIGLGTLLGHSIYFLGGTLAANFLKTWQFMFYWVIGGILTFTIVLQLIRILRSRDVAEQLRATHKEHPEEQDKTMDQEPS